MIYNPQMDCNLIMDYWDILATHNSILGTMKTNVEHITKYWTLLLGYALVLYGNNLVWIVFVIVISVSSTFMHTHNPTNTHVCNVERQNHPGGSSQTIRFGLYIFFIFLHRVWPTNNEMEKREVQRVKRKLGMRPRWKTRNRGNGKRMR